MLPKIQRWSIWGPWKYFSLSQAKCRRNWEQIYAPTMSRWCLYGRSFQIREFLSQVCDREIKTRHAEVFVTFFRRYRRIASFIRVRSSPAALTFRETPSKRSFLEKSRTLYKCCNVYKTATLKYSVKCCADIILITDLSFLVKIFES